MRPLSGGVNGADNYRDRGGALDTAQTVEDMDGPGFRLHALKGQMRGRWSITVNGNCV